MFNNLSRVVVTGGNGRFANIIKKNLKKNFFFPSKKDLNILSLISIEKYIKKIKPKIIIHAAGLSRPMEIHEKDINSSINLNIIGTANIVQVCNKFNIKIIYLSTTYVYPGKKGNYKEVDPILPINNYAWSKLGGEASVQMYKNSLILRICMTEKPFTHKKAISDLKTNFLYHDEVAKIIPYLLNFQGILNIGGKSQTPYKFAKNSGLKIRKISKNKTAFKHLKNISISTKKFRKLINFGGEKGIRTLDTL